MKHNLSILVLFLAANVASASEVPFSFSRSAPDYSATMIGRSKYSKPETYLSSVVHHTGWTRVEAVRNGVTNITYGNPRANVVLRAAKVGDGDFSTILVRKAIPSRDYEGIESAKVTYNSENLAGEDCKWWEITRRGSGNGSYGPFWFSCQSTDGIEIAAKTMLSHEKQPMRDTRLIKLTRGPIAPSEVRPPQKLFRPDFWLKPLRQYPERPATAVDFEAKMVSGGSELRVLRHFPWRSEERRDEDGTIRVTVWNELEDQGILIHSSKDEHWFRTSRSPGDPDRSPPGSFDITTGQLDLKRSDEYLGEACNWFDMTPNMADRGKEQCLTADGISLREYRVSWGAREDLAAVSIRRRPVGLEELLPPAALMGQHNFGFDKLN